MYLIYCIFIVIFCVAFCWLLKKVLEVEQDIEVLYTRYSDELNKMILINLNRNGD